MVPDIFARAFGSPCYAFSPDVSTACAEPIQGTTRVVPAYTSAGRYPPPYYMVVGLPSLIFPSAFGIHLMRLVSALISAALLASAFASARALTNSKHTNSAYAVIGVGVAITPMVIYLSASVNPNGMEIAASIGLWASLILLVLDHSSDPAPRLGLRTGVAASALVLSRPLSPLWLMLIVLLVIAMAKRERLLLLMRSGVVWLSILASGIFSLSAGVWVLYSNALELLSVNDIVSDDVALSEVFRTSLGKTGNEILHMIGTFGWLDTASPLITYYAWFACIGFLGFASLVTAERRQKLVLAMLASLVVLLPRAIEISQARELGYAWQGRYTLPLAVGLPIIASLLAGNLWTEARRRLTNLLVSSLVVGHVLAFWWALRRYAVGVNGPMWPDDWPASIQAVELLIMFTLTASAHGWWLTRLAARDPSGADEGFGTDGDRETDPRTLSSIATSAVS